MLAGYRTLAFGFRVGRPRTAIRAKAHGVPESQDRDLVLMRREMRRNQPELAGGTEDAERFVKYSLGPNKKTARRRSFCSAVEALRYRLFAQQPGVDNSPLVASPRLEIQEWRLRIL
jgi:hypothetical protein